jgi:hypothetical protein
MTSKNVATNHHGTSIFRNEASTTVVAAKKGATIDKTITRQNSNQSSEFNGTALFVVDMDMTSQGEIMCEEVSHLSDPTSYMLTTPIHTRAPPSRGRSQRVLPDSNNKNHGNRLLSASSLLKKPIAAIIRNHHFGQKKHQQPRLEHQVPLSSSSSSESSSSKPRKNSIGNTFVEESTKTSPHMRVPERVPLTLMVPLGNSDGGNNCNDNYQYHSIPKQIDAENRDPTRHRDKTDRFHSNLDLYNNPSLSWEDDHLLLFDDNNTVTPRAPLILGVVNGSALTRNHGNITCAKKSMSNKSHPSSSKNATTTFLNSWMTSFCSRRGESGSWSYLLLPTLFEQWGYVMLGVSTILFVIAIVYGVKLETWDTTTMLDLLLWALTSFTTIGSVSVWSIDKEHGGVEASSTVFMVLTSLYAILGVSTLGVVWGRYSRTFVKKSFDDQRRLQNDLQRQALDTFCGPSHRGRHPPPRFPLDLGPSDSESALCNGRCFLSGVVTLAVMTLLARAAKWNVLESVYHAIVIACTLGDNVMSSQTTITKVLNLLLIPLVLVAMLRYLTTIANWTVKNTQTKEMISIENISLQDLVGLLEATKLEDGLLTRADFLEMMLLSMKKVDPDLIMSIREGFQKVTRGGSIDLTRTQLIESAMNALTET